MFIQLDDRKTDEFAKSASNGRFSSCLPVLIDNLNTLTDIAAYVAIRRNVHELTSEPLVHRHRPL